jgi:hypothetical protein
MEPAWCTATTLLPEEIGWPPPAERSEGCVVDERNPLKRLIIVLALVCSLGLVAISSSSARPKVTEHARTFISSKRYKEADGTVVVKVSFKSANPRCLAAKRFNLGKAPEAFFIFGGPYVVGGNTYPIGAGGTGSPKDRGGVLHPVSPAGRSPYVWEAQIAPTAIVKVELGEIEHGGPFKTEEERFPTYTVSEAAAVAVGGMAPGSPQTPDDVWVTGYNSNGELVTLECSVAPLFGSKEFENLICDFPL